MLRKLVPVLIGILLIAVGFVFFKNFKINGFGNLKVVPRTGDDTEASQSAVAETKTNRGFFSFAGRKKGPSEAQKVVQSRRVIRIASFNLDALNATKARKSHVVDIFARIVKEFDIIALQEIQSETDDLIPRLTDLVNRFGGNYDFVIGPRLGPVGVQEQYAFIFNGDSVEVDRTEIYTVDDRDDLMMREPLVTWFRTKGVVKQDAFTFSLVNVHIDPRRAQMELDVLDDIMFEVRRDGRNEDDVLLMGDFGVKHDELGRVSQLSDAAFAVVNLATKTDGKGSVDNIVFQKTPTTEFTGRSGVFDFLREYNLSMEQALEISDHMPVWAEFSILENGEAGRVAKNGSTVERK